MSYKVTEIKYVGWRKIWKEPSYGELGEMGWDSPTGRVHFWILGCPRCGIESWLQHEVKVIDEKVTINPSVGCPHCHAHYFVRDSKIDILPDF